MKKITAFLLSAVVSFSMCSCTNNMTASDNGGSSDSITSDSTQEENEQCASKYALTVAEYKYIPQYKENEVYLIHGNLTFSEQEEWENDNGIKCGYVFFDVGDEKYNNDERYSYFITGMYGVDISYEKVQELGIKEGEEMYFLYKNPVGTVWDERRDWGFCKKDDFDILSKQSGLDCYFSEDNKYISNINGSELVSAQGYLFVSAEEADAAYEKMISEGGISTEKYKKASSEE